MAAPQAAETASAGAYPEHRRRQLLAVMPSALLAVFTLTLLYAAAECVLSPAQFYPSLPFYGVQLSVPLIALSLLHRPLRRYVEGITLLGDLTFSAALAGGLLLPSEAVSTTAIFLSLKMVATAMLFPWGPGFQCASAGGSLLLYAAFLAVSGRSGEAFGGLPYVLGPVVAAVLSAVGSRQRNRTRRTLFQDSRRRARTEAALREVQEQLELAVTASSAGLWESDLRTGRSQYSPSWRTLFGYGQDDLGDGVREWETLIHPEDAERARAYVREYLRNPSAPYEIELRVRDRNGDYRWVLSRATVIRDAAGTPRRLLGLHVDITARKRAEEQRHQAERRFQRLFDANILGIVIFDIGGTVHEANEVFLQMVGWRREELPLPLASVTPSEWREVDQRAAAELRHGGVAAPWQQEFVRRDGTRIPVLLGAAVVNEGKDTGVGFALDLTAQKRAEENTAALLQVAHDISGTLEVPELCARVQQQTAHLLRCERVVTFYWHPARQVFRVLGHRGIPAHLVAATEAIEVTAKDFPDFDRRLLQGEAVVYNDMSRTTEAIAQLSAKFGITGMTAAPLKVWGAYRGALLAFRTTTGDSFDPWQCELLKGVANEFAVGMEAIEQHAAQRDQAVVSAALVGVGEGLIAALGSATLLDQLCKLTTEALGCERSHTALRQPGGDAFKLVAAHGYPSEVAESLRAVDLPLAVLGDLLPKLERTDVHQVTEADLSEAMQIGRREVGIDVELVMALRRSGEIIGIHSASYHGRHEPFSPLQEHIARRIAHLASLALDNFRLVQELERANRLKSDFLATISHELRTPLNILIGYNDLLRDGAFGTLLPEQSETLGRIDRSARELLDLISATLDLSRLEAGQVPLQLEDIAPAELMEQVRAELQNLCETKPWLSVQWEAAPALPRIRTDRMKAKVVLKNLFSNAMKYTDRGHVSVRVAAAEGGVEFTVDDTGIGIAPEMQRAIFEPFRQTDEVIARHQGGVGLGLYIVRRLLELLGGTIHVESEPGRRSCFRVRLPLDVGIRSEAERPPS